MVVIVTSNYQYMNIPTVNIMRKLFRILDTLFIVTHVKYSYLILINLLLKKIKCNISIQRFISIYQYHYIKVQKTILCFSLSFNFYTVQYKSLKVIQNGGKSKKSKTFFVASPVEDLDSFYQKPFPK